MLYVYRVPALSKRSHVCNIWWGSRSRREYTRKYSGCGESRVTDWGSLQPRTPPMFRLWVHMRDGSQLHAGQGSPKIKTGVPIGTGMPADSVVIE